MVVSFNQISNNTDKSSFATMHKTSFGQNKHPKSYYTYVSYDANEGRTLAIAGGAFVGLTAACAFGASKLLAPISKKLALLTGFLTAIPIVLTGIYFKYQPQKLKPISGEEQAIKEKKIKEFVFDTAAKKGVDLNGFCFYDFSKSKINKNVLASFDQQTGYLVLNSQFQDTNLDINKAKPLVVHELTHAKQFENISRSKDGLYDLNKILVINEIKNMDDEKKKRIINTPNEKMEELVKYYMQKEADKYTFVNDKLDTENDTKCLKAVKMYLKNPNVSKSDLPLMFDEKYYAKLAKKGALTPEEEQKVKTYLDYMARDAYANAQYKPVGISISKEINYRNDPMEVEAYAATDKYDKTGEIN